jgi:ABC-2 type transport system ATP-binding protein
VTVAVSIDGLSKRFRLYNEKFTSLKERLIHPRRIPYRDFWALKDINLEIEQGETVGLLGHNGSGKSTLLKCIAGILMPTEGEIRTAGRVAALLELGAGFSPDLSGRENVFLNAALLGLSRRDVEARFDDIVGFAELEEHIDQQVKYYSSGMYVRLGFAVAVNVDPDILLVDEVLAVGDELFQRKCLDRVHQFQREGRTIIFVTHGADMVRQICDRVAVLHEGQRVAWGEPGEAVRSYREHLLKRQAYTEEAHQLVTAVEESIAFEAETHGDGSPPAQDGRITITSVMFEHPNSEEHDYLVAGDPMTIRIGYAAVERVDDVLAVVVVYDNEGRVLFLWRSDYYGGPNVPLEGRGEIAFTFDDVPLLDGTYPVSVGLHSHDGGTVYEWREQQHSFSVMNPHPNTGLFYLPAKVEVRPESLAPAGSSRSRAARQRPA